MKIIPHTVEKTDIIEFEGKRFHRRECRWITNQIGRVDIVWWNDQGMIISHLNPEFEKIYQKYMKREDKLKRILHG